MPRKRKFYSYSRYTDKTDGNIKQGYLPREGFDVPNEYGLELAVYKTIDQTMAAIYNYKEVKTWFVVDCRCGLSVGNGSTKKEAIEECFKKLEKVDWATYMEKRDKFLEQHGDPPGYRAMYL